MPYEIHDIKLLSQKKYVENVYWMSSFWKSTNFLIRDTRLFCKCREKISIWGQISDLRSNFRCRVSFQDTVKLSNCDRNFQYEVEKINFEANFSFHGAKGLIFVMILTDCGSQFRSKIILSDVNYLRNFWKARQWKFINPNYSKKCTFIGFFWFFVRIKA